VHNCLLLVGEIGVLVTLQVHFCLMALGVAAAGGWVYVCVWLCHLCLLLGAGFNPLLRDNRHSTLPHPPCLLQAQAAASARPEHA
jgi:hypothetical protein